jgi:AcrR family transcriptional regulator
MAERRSKSKNTKGERRRVVLDHAVELFARQGYAATTLEEIAQASSLAPSVLARVFKDKPAIVRGLVEDMFSRLSADPDAAPANPDWPDKLQALFHSFRADGRSQTSPARVLIKILTEGDSEARGAIAEGMSTTIQPMVELVRGGQLAGVFRRTLDPERAAWEILRALFGLALLDRVEPASPVDPEHPSIGIECLLHGLLKTDV